MFNRHRLRISLRVLMLLILLLGIWLGWRVNKARAQREAVAAVRKFGGWVHFDYEFKNGPVSVPRGHAIWKPSWGTLSPGKSPSAPVWLRRMLGDEYFQDIAHVSLFVDIVKGQAHAEPYNIGPADDVLAKLASQKGIRTLQIGGQQATNRGMAYVDSMTGLEELIIFPANQISDEGVAHLTGLRNLRVLFITNSQVTDAGLRHLSRLRSVEHLTLEGMGFSDRGLAYLSEMNRLKSLSLWNGVPGMTDIGLASLGGLKDLELLDLRGCKVTDRGLEQLLGLTKLRALSLDGSLITQDGRNRLQASMPGLKIQ
jgi:Leucine Rich repeat